mmetsp:Transcript_21973/g.45187  ORF Transcript_21973/g.45187 Transcript_21973/m.45187 type:complete len:346 (-) Transcript_21973:137-1174(-)
MAAILCKPITSCFEFICTAPCKLCSAGCNGCGDLFSNICTNPLSAFVMVTFVTQIPLALAAALELGGLFSGCKGSQWLVGMLAVAIAHMFTSVYLAIRVTNSTDEALKDKHTSWERISYLLCHDPWIAIYLLIVIFYVVWLIVGSTWSITGALYLDCDLGSNGAIVLVFGWIYLFLGPAVLSCNLCCVCCDKRDYAGDEEAFAAAQAETEATQQKKQSTSTSGGNFEAYTADDIERQAEPKQQSSPAPRTYSADGMPIPDDGSAPAVVEAEVVVEEGTLPPPMAPPKNKVDEVSEKVNKNIATAQGAFAKAAKDAKVDEKLSKFGGFFSKKKKGSDAPKQEATLY